MSRWEDCKLQVRLRDVVTDAPLQKLEGDSGQAHSVAFSTDSRLVVSRSHDMTVGLWDAATGRPLRTLEGHSHEVHSLTLVGEPAIEAAQELVASAWHLDSGGIATMQDARRATKF